MVARLKPNVVIMDISIPKMNGTVNTHRANLKQKLNIHDTAGLVRYAVQEGIVIWEK
jgi:DNA-binding NarL/FixJ family response regulator